MIKIIAKILLAIAILWTLAFIFKLGSSFAASPKSEMYNSCYEDGTLSEEQFKKAKNKLLK